MNKKFMAVTFIIIGAVLLTCGIVMLFSNNQFPEANIAQQKQVKMPALADPVPDPISKPEAKHQSTPANQSPTVQETLSEKKTDSAKEKGNAFENFVVNLLADWRFKLLDRTNDMVSSDGVVAESCMNPDLHVHQKRKGSDIDYFIECKYRSDWKDGKITFEDRQMNRYRKFQKENRRKVLFALGVGGSPSSPATFLIVPVDSMKDNSIMRINTQFAVEPSSSALAEYINHYFSTVFSKAKDKKNN